MPLFLQNMAIYPLFGELCTFLVTLNFYNILHTYALSNILYLGEKSVNLISNYHGTFIHIFMYRYYHIKKKIKPFFCQCCRIICWRSFFLANVTSKTLSFFKSWNVSQVDIIKVYVMSYTISQSSSTFHSLFNKEKTSAEIETKLDLISSLWDDDHILRIDKKTGTINLKAL